MTALGDAALGYAARGWRVLRLAPRGKVPMVRGGSGYKEATTAAETVAQWWCESPEANVGIATVGDLFVLDVDPRNGGDRSLAELLDGRALPPTPEVHTGGGGRHFYLAAEPHTGDLGDGLDVKAGKGYVVAPPSIHPSGREYTWHPERGPDTARASLPRWLAAKLERKSPKPKWLPPLTATEDYLKAIPPPQYVEDLTDLAVGPGGGKVRCPFHDDRTPSLHVYPTAERGWRCYGCRRGGDIYQLGGFIAGFLTAPGDQLRGADFLRVQGALLDHYSKRLGVDAA